MKHSRNIQDDDGDGLDSLLDTMTNVVGILVMVLIATQLGVKDAVDRIAKSEESSQESLLGLEEKHTSTLALQRQLEDRFKNIGTESAREVELSSLRQQFERTNAQFKEAAASTQVVAVKLERDQKKAAEVTELIESQRKERDRLSTELTKGLDDEATLKALLTEYTGLPGSKEENLTLPNPRPVPAGAKQFVLLCMSNKIYPLFFNEENRKALRQQIEFIVQQRKLFQGVEVGVDPDVLLPLVNKKPPLDDYFIYDLTRSGIHPRISFRPRKERGIELREVLGAKSRFNQFLDNVDRNKFYMRFFVFPDSFEVYMAARKAADKRGILAGWEPQNPDWVYTTHLGGNVLFGAKPPPPKPNPNPAPPKPAPKLID